MVMNLIIHLCENIMRGEHREKIISNIIERKKKYHESKGS